MKSLFFLCLLFVPLSVYAQEKIPPQRVCLRAEPGEYQIILRFPNNREIKLDYSAENQDRRICKEVTVSYPVSISLVFPNGSRFVFSTPATPTFRLLQLYAGKEPEWVTYANRKRTGFGNTGALHPPESH